MKIEINCSKHRTYLKLTISDENVCFLSTLVIRETQGCFISSSCKCFLLWWSQLMMTYTYFYKYHLIFQWGFQEILFFVINRNYSRHSFYFPCHWLLFPMLLSWCYFLNCCILSHFHFFLSINYKWKVPSSKQDHLSHIRDLYLFLLKLLFLCSFTSSVIWDSSPFLMSLFCLGKYLL